MPFLKTLGGISTIAGTVASVIPGGQVAGAALLAGGAAANMANEANEKAKAKKAAPQNPNLPDTQPQASVPSQPILGMPPQTQMPGADYRSGNTIFSRQPPITGTGLNSPSFPGSRTDPTKVGTAMPQMQGGNAPQIQGGTAPVSPDFPGNNNQTTPSNNVGGGIDPLAKGIDNATPGPETPGGNGADYGKWSNALAWGQQALNLGSSIWNMTRKPNEMPQPDQVEFDRVNYETSALEAGLANNRNRGTANALYGARGAGMTGNELSGVYANQMGQMSQDAMQVEQVENEERRVNASIQQQEDSINSDVNNRFAGANAEYLNNFDSQRGMYLTQGLSNIGTIERDRMNSQMNINSANQAMGYSDLNDEFDRYAQNPDDPKSPLLRPDGTYMSRNEFINSRMGMQRLSRPYA